MPKLTEEDLKRKKAELAQVVYNEELGGWKGPWLPDYYDNRKECWRENIAFKRVQERKAAGQNEHGQTPEQEKAFKARLERAKLIKEKAEVAEQMVANVKGAR